jgi:hypothetical protein
VVLDALVQLAFQHPEIVFTLGWIVAIGLSWNRVPATVPVIPGLYVSGAVVLGVSGFYFWTVPDPSTGLERLYLKMSEGIFLAFLILGAREVVKIKAG